MSYIMYCCSVCLKCVKCVIEVIGLGRLFQVDMERDVECGASYGCISLLWEEWRVSWLCVCRANVKWLL